MKLIRKERMKSLEKIKSAKEQLLHEKKAREELAKSTNAIEKRNFWLTKQCHDLETRLSAEVEKRLESNRKLESEKAKFYKEKKDVMCLVVIKI